MIYVIGIGVDGRDGLGRRALGVIGRAGLVAGAARHLLEAAPVISPGAKRVSLTGDLAALARYIRGYMKRGSPSARPVAVLATGDPSLFGIAGFIIREFGRRSVEVIPAVSTALEAFARIKESANGLKVVSVHGRDDSLEDAAREIAANDRVAVFTGPKRTPAKLARALLDIGAVGYEVHVCSDLGARGERVVRGTLRETAQRAFPSLSTMILIREPGTRAGLPEPCPPAPLPDSAFASDSSMMTKQEVRTVALSKLCISRESTVWDIGAGSGTVAVEAARIARLGRVVAVEKSPKRAACIRANRSRFDVANLDIITGAAPECMKHRGLARPDAVFIGGGGRAIGAIMRYAGARLLPGGRMVVNAVTVETASRAAEFFRKRGWEKEMVMMSVARAREAGELGILSAYNPVFITTGVRP